MYSYIQSQQGLRTQEKEERQLFVANYGGKVSVKGVLSVCACGIGAGRREKHATSIPQPTTPDGGLAPATHLHTHTYTPSLPSSTHTQSTPPQAFNGRWPIMACYNFQRYPSAEFTDCDGSKAAQAFCSKEGYARALGYACVQWSLFVCLFLCQCLCTVGLMPWLVHGLCCCFGGRASPWWWCLFQPHAHHHPTDTQHIVHSYGTTDFKTLGVPSAFFMGTQNVAEAGILPPGAQVLTEVKCDQV